MANSFRHPFKRKIGITGAYNVARGKNSLSVLESQFLATESGGGATTSARFDASTGDVVRGPARKPLTRFDVVESNGNVYLV